MEESTTYQELVARSLARGRVEEARSILLAMGEERFGPPPAEIRAEIEKCSLERLEPATRSFYRATGWHDVLRQAGV